MSSLLLRAPDDRDQLLQLLRMSQERKLIDAEAMSMIEGVLQVTDLSASDIMVPRSKMDVIDISRPPSEFVPFAIRTAHSRFPVVDGDLENVVGLLHAKDLLRLFVDRPLTARELLRPAVFIPESKRLDVLLRDFRLNRNHLALVVDEYGRVSGLVTIEDVLELIVGEIEDEFDSASGTDDILAVESGAHGTRFRVQARTDLSTFNEHFLCAIDDAEHDTIGGVVTSHFGRVPRRGERIEVDGLAFEVLRADARTVQTLLVERLRSTGQA
jgi:magnesium and cobalt transporter